jgi:hypothetical protein
MDYATLVRKLGSLHSLLYDMQQDGVHQGEHTIIYSDRNGDERTLHVPDRKLLLCCRVSH